MDLFIAPAVEFEKSAAETALPEDPNSWSHEVLQELYKQAPYIADFSPHVEMEKVDGEKGYGLGHIEVGNQTEMPGGAPSEQQAAAGVRAVRIPVIIADGMLKPFDLLITDDSKVQPLTENRLRAAIFRPQSFDVTSRTPGDQSMVGQLYPPFRQSYGFGGGVGVNVGMGKEGSVFEQFLTKSAEGHCDSCGGGKCKCACAMCKTACGYEKTAGHVEEYLESGGQKHGRGGKKMASGDARMGMLDEFVNKHASASGAVRSALARGAATVGEKATKNTAAAKGHAVSAAARAKRILAGLRKTGSVLEAISGTLSEPDLWSFKLAMADQSVHPLLLKNAAAIAGSVERIMSEPERPKLASVFSSFVRPSVVQLRRMDDTYWMKTASHHFWSPDTVELTRTEAIQKLGEKMVLAADLEGAVTTAEGEGVSEEGELDSDMQKAGPVTAPGLYKVETADGQEAIGYAIPNPIGPDGTELPLTLFTNGTQAAIQTDVIGVPVEGGGVDLPSADAPTKRGFFASEGPEGIKATVPFTIKGSVGGMEGEPTSYAATAFSGEEVHLSVQPNIETVVPSDGGLLIPEHWTWVPLDGADEIVLASAEGHTDKQASARRSLASVEVRAGGSGTWSVSGHAVDKLAYDQREMLGIDDAMFLLAGLGVDQDYGVRKLAEASNGQEPVRVRVGRHIKLAGAEMEAARSRAADVLDSLPQLRVPHLLKEAATIGDPMAVDTVLSLGFINPENITTFVGYLPQLDDAQAKLCDILMASRLGSLIETPDGAIERCVRSLEAVLEGLKALAFQTN